MHGLAVLLAAAATGPVSPHPTITLDDVGRFPPWCVCKERLARADERLAYLQAMAAFSAYWRENNSHLLEDARWRREVWWSACCVRNEHWEHSWRLDRLARLQFALGWEDYLAGRMPAP